MYTPWLLRLLRLIRILIPSLRALLAHRARSLLAVLGVAVGVAAVQFVTAIGAGAQAEVLAGMSAQGGQLLVVRPAVIKRLVARKQVQGKMTTLTPSDAEVLAALKTVARVAPAVDGSFRIRTPGSVGRALVLGTTASFLDVRGFHLASGGFFTEQQDSASERVLVLGARIRAVLFPGGAPISREVWIGSVPFEVIGTLEPQGVTADGADVDMQVYIPLRTALRRLFNVQALGSVFVQVRDSESLSQAEVDMRKLLRERHRLDLSGRPDDFSIQDPQKAAVARRQVSRAIALFTGGLAAVSLLVGGTGILALMLLSVRERTSEIGLRRAVGARPADVLAQFLAEAVVLSAVGGAVGVAAGAICTRAAAAITGWSIQTPSWAVLAGIGLSAAMGLFFGAWPARQAARLTPVVALSRS